MAAIDGTFGQVYDRFWDDPEVGETWTPEDRYFWLYLLTCPQRNILGVFEFSLRNVAMHLGYSHESVLKLIERFEMYGKIMYSRATREIAIKNWLKYRGNNVWTNDNLMKGVRNRAAEVKNKDLLAFVEGLDRIIDIEKTESTKSLGTVYQDSMETDGRPGPTLGHSYTLTLGHSDTSTLLHSDTAKNRDEWGFGEDSVPEPEKTWDRPKVDALIKLWDSLKLPPFRKSCINVSTVDSAPMFDALRFWTPAEAEEAMHNFATMWHDKAKFDAWNIPTPIGFLTKHIGTHLTQSKPFERFAVQPGRGPVVEMTEEQALAEIQRRRASA
jgi:hypothetical protein